MLLVKTASYGNLFSTQKTLETTTDEQPEEMMLSMMEKIAL